jgi:hypothetical protein
MPPQQGDRLLDVVDNIYDFIAHSLSLRLFVKFGTCIKSDAADVKAAPKSMRMG